MSKLLKFRPCIDIDQAAIWLGSLIGEDLCEDDIWQLHHDWHLPLVIGGPLIGLPVMPPTEGLDGPWTIAWRYTPDVVPTIYADYLHFPVGKIPTELGDAPVLNVDGTLYAWFESLYGAHAPADMENIIPIDFSGEYGSMVCPNDILRIAACANSDEPVTPCFHKERQNHIWSYTANGAMVLHSSSMPETGVKAVEAKQPPHPKQDPPSFRLAVAALLDLLRAPVEHPRPQGMNQEAIKTAILHQFPWRGLSKRNLEDMFAAANKAKADAE